VAAHHRDLVQAGRPAHALENLPDDLARTGDRVHQGQRPGAHGGQVVEVGGDRGHPGAVGIGRHERGEDGLAADHQGNPLIGHDRAVVARPGQPVGALEYLADQADLGLGRDARVIAHGPGQSLQIDAHRQAPFLH